MKMELECQECDKVFSRSTKTVFPKCPRCKSEDLYPTAFFGRKKKVWINPWHLPPKRGII